MIEGIVWAVAAGVMLGLYALPEKFTKDYKFENTWSMFFAIATFIIPVIVALSLIKGYGGVLSGMPADILIKMAITSFLWGIGVMLWGKAINHIGLSLGFSLFIGSLILIGSLLPFIVDGVPPKNAFLTIMGGILVVLVGIFANGKAGMQRQKDEGAMDEQQEGKGSMGMGILIAVIGGVLATGFSFANAVGRPLLHEGCQAAGNPEWVTALAVMVIIYIVGGVPIAAYFIWQLSKKSYWGNFRTSYLGRNLTLTTVMAILNFAASATFAFAAFKLGRTGNTVGYAIFNTMSIVVAIVSGLITREWVNASARAKSFLYLGLGCMVVGVVVIAIGNSLAA
ncbi:L-rhamnose/proton symporter RhaT [Bacteroidota bacterium]